MDDDKFYVPNRLEIKPGAFYFVANARTQKRYWPLNAIRIAAQPLLARRHPCIVSSLPREAPIRDVRYYPLSGQRGGRLVNRKALHL